MRLTVKKVSTWHARVERARKTLHNVEQEVRADRLKAKGGDLYELTKVTHLLGDTVTYARVAEDGLAVMVKREERKADAATPRITTSKEQA